MTTSDLDRTGSSARTRAAGALAVAAVLLAGCGGSAASSPNTDTPSTRGDRPTATSADSTQAVAVTSAALPAPPGNIQGLDNNGNAYGDFKVTVKVVPHLAATDSLGDQYQQNPACDQFQLCDPPGSAYIHFTLTFTNPTAEPEQFRAVGFTLKGGGAQVVLAAPTSDQGATPARSFGAPVSPFGSASVTQDNLITYWQYDRLGQQPYDWGPTSAFPQPWASNHFLFQTFASMPDDTNGLSGGPDTLGPGQSIDVEYVTGSVAAGAPLGLLTIWVGVHLQQVH